MLLNEYIICFHQIQSICWHPSEAQNLLSGSGDQTVCLVDCRDANNKSCQHRWTFDSDIERVTWNTFNTNQYLVRMIEEEYGCFCLLCNIIKYRHQPKMDMFIVWISGKRRNLFLVYLLIVML